MPAGTEIIVMSNFINDEFKDEKVVRVEKSPISKNKCDLSCLEGKEWSVTTKTRGKEMMISFIGDDETLYMKMNFGKIASVEKFEKGKEYECEFYDRRAMLRMYGETKTITFSDFSRLLYWRWCGEWDKNRSPDVYQEHEEWKKFIYQNRNIAYFKRSVFDVMADQRFFNGIGNFLRTEILYRMRFSPFIPFVDVLNSDLYRNEFFDVIKSFMFQVIEYGGFQCRFWKNPNGMSTAKMNSIVKCYNKKDSFRMKDSEKGYFWYDKKWNYDRVNCVMKKNRI